jgi:hypothetical protein
MLALGTYYNGFYKFLLVCHILAAIVGIGANMLTALYGSEARKRPGPAGRAITEANLHVSEIATNIIYLVFVFGFLLVLFSGDVIKFSQTWVWLAMLLFIIAIGISHGVMKPSAKRIIALQTEMEQGPPPAGGPPPQVVQMQETGKKLAAGGATLNLIVVVILALMIWQPGR